MLAETAPLIIENFPSTLEFIIAIGVVAAALAAIYKLWNIFVKSISGKLQEEVIKLENNLKKVDERVNTIEKELLKINSPTINSRLEKMEKKLDDLMTFLLKAKND